VKTFKVLFAFFLIVVLFCIIVDNVYRVHRRKNYPEIAIKQTLAETLQLPQNVQYLFRSSTSMLVHIRHIYIKNQYRGELRPPLTKFMPQYMVLSKAGDTVRLIRLAL
jgi:hypothetical protein